MTVLSVNGTSSARSCVFRAVTYTESRRSDGLSMLLGLVAGLPTSVVAVCAYATCHTGVMASADAIAKAIGVGRNDEDERRDERRWFIRDPSKEGCFKMSPNTARRSWT